MQDDVSTGQYLMRRLKAQGVDTVFGMPGVHTLELYRGIAAERIAHVLVRHEQGAGFMADGYARVTGRPGVCTLITGPGLTNALTPIGQAFSDSVPMLVLSSVNPLEHGGLGQGRLHEITDQQAVVAPLVGLTRTATDAAGVDAFVADAYEMFAARRPRPAHLQMPVDVLSAPCGRPADGGPLDPAPRPRAATDEIERAARLLAGAERPAIIAGGGALGAAERAGAPGRAAGRPRADDRSPARAWCPTGTRSRSARHGPRARPARCWPGPTWCWRSAPSSPRPTTGPTGRASPARSSASTSTGPSCTTPCRPSCRCSPMPAWPPHDILDSLGAGQRDWVGRARRGRGLGRPPGDRRGGGARTQPGFRSALGALREALPADAVVATDMTQLAYAANSGLPVDRPRSYLHPVGFGTLGYALPAAIGAKVAAPDRPVIAVAGDGGFLFTLAELGTAVELGLSLPIVLWDNDGLGQIRDDMIARQMPQIGVNPQNPDYLAVARGFGAEAVEVAGPRALAAELRAALARPSPTLLRVRAASFP